MLQSPRDAVQSCSRCCPLQVKGIRIHLHGLPIQNPALSSQLHLVRTPHQTEAHHLLVYQAVFLWRTALQVSLFPSLLFWLTLLWRSCAVPHVDPCRNFPPSLPSPLQLPPALPH